MWITVQLTLHGVAGGECDQLGGENPTQCAGWDGDTPHRQVPTLIGGGRVGVPSFKHNFEYLYACSV